MRLSSLFGVLLLGVTVAGCATSNSPESIAQNDPYEPTNRKIFNFDVALDHHVATQIAKAYIHVIPAPARDGVHNFLVNLGKPVVFANDVLQGKPSRAGQTLGRVAINSTLGVGGLIDVASKVGIPEHSEDFGQTLAVWGTPEGPYLVVPFVGPDPPRDAGGSIVDIFLDPLTYIKFHGSDTWMAVRSGVSILDSRAQSVDTVEQIERTSIDYYATARSLYRQHRDAEIRDGQPNLQELPNL